MKNLLKKSTLFIVAILACSLISFSFIGYESTSKTPGTISFIGEAGSPNTFIFNKWNFTEVDIPEDNIEAMKVTLEINTSSLSTGWKDLEKNIRKKKDYFYVKKFPKAIVKIDGATKIDNGTYTTDAILTLKGVTKPVTLNFEISDTPPYKVKGNGVIQRKDFKFTGDGPKWEVPVSFDAVLEVAK